MHKVKADGFHYAVVILVAYVFRGICCDKINAVNGKEKAATLQEFRTLIQWVLQSNIAF